MTSKPDWADKAADEFFYGDLGDRKGFATALRQAFAEGERAGIEAVAVWAEQQADFLWIRCGDSDERDAYLAVARFARYIRAAKETKE